MSNVITSEFVEMSLPFSADNAYQCLSHNGYIYIIVETDGIYKYDPFNKVFTKIYTISIPVYKAFIYNEKIYYMRDWHVNNSYHPVFMFDSFDLLTSERITNAITITSNLTITGVGATSGRTAFAGDVNFYNNQIFFSWTGGAYYSNANNLYYNSKWNGYIQYDIVNDKKVRDTQQFNGAAETTINEYHFSAYQSEAWKDKGFYEVRYKYYGDYNNFINCAYDFQDSCAFNINDDYYILGGDKQPRNVICYNKTTNTFSETKEFTLPFDTVKKSVGYYNDGDSHYIIFYPTGVFIINFISYSLLYKIASNNGSIVYKELSNSAPINKIRFSYSGNTVGYIFNTLSDDITGFYNPQIPEGYVLVGYSFSAEGKQEIALNKDIEINISQNAVFYEVYGKFIPPKTTFDLSLYQNTAEANRVDKSLFLTSVGSLSGALRERCSLVSPILVIEYPKVPDFNYVYIEAFGRYYFVTGVVSVRYNLWEISLECDVLMTYKDKLLECEAFIDRNENTFNPLIVDRRKVIEQGQNVIALTTENDVFGDTGSYIMVASNTGVTSADAAVIFDSGVTVKIGDTDISSGDKISAYPVIVTCNKEICYINGRVLAKASVIEIEAQQSIYITTGGADREVAFAVTINETPD